MKRIAAVLLLASCATTSSDPHQKDAAVIEQWGRDPVIVRAVAVQNAGRLTADEIRQIDRSWTEGGEQARISQLMSNAVASRLRELVAQHAYSEAFAMDDQGALVAMTQKTSDYWQGDEPKWQQSFNGGRGAVFIDSAQFDASTGSVLTQISVPVRDGDLVIGALTVGVKSER